VNKSDKAARIGAAYLDSANWHNSSPGWVREALGGSLLKETEQKAVAALAQAGIPHLIIGGLAVGEHGYNYGHLSF
jgi:hypothetical protein